MQLKIWNERRAAVIEKCFQEIASRSVNVTLSYNTNSLDIIYEHILYIICRYFSGS